ncbi:MAG TPA: PQQ-binding-like beta-propeller repeat protein [Actinomycetota bacterium]|nr:PQQ-binding-like beta-propeller repeat protein [Actinomycetota bacterium]
MLAAAVTVLAVGAASAAWSQTPDQVPAAESATETGAPWPTMRHDLRNTGASDLPGIDPGTQPWSFQTGRGIFSTPVVAADGTVYIGSADHNLYGLNEQGQEVWRFKTGGIIDTAPALLDDRTLIIGSGDEAMYKVSTDPAIPAHQRTVWTFKPTLPPVEGAQLVSWWEGSPNVGPDGVIYQGNTGGGAYAVNPDGSQKWVYQAQNAVWTVPALDDSGVSYWGSVDLRIFALNPDGTQKWQRTTLGYVTSSPALGPDGTLYAGSFDGSMYALDSADGSVKWKLQTGDHIYSSPALVEQDGALQQIIIGSTDGLLYSVNPAGELLWSYDTGAPIRSSPVVGQPPVPGGTPIVYVGAANGRVIAVNVNDGSLRWGFDTTSAEPALATRNQLNSSPALGPEGVYIGGQDGAVWYVPYDYCLRDGTPDIRCDAAQLPTDGSYLYGVDVGGGLVARGLPAQISPAGYFTGRVVVRKQGRTVPARLVPAPDPKQLVTIDPPVQADVSVSGDGRYVFVRPLEMLPANTTFTVTVEALVTTGGPRLGNVPLGTGNLEPFRGSFTAHTGDDGTAWNPKTGADATSGLSLSRLAVPLPPMLTSVNQIGFDFYDWIGGAVQTEGDPVVWFIGARRDAQGNIVADPSARFAFPVSGPQRGGTFLLSTAGVDLWFTFGPVPLRRFDLRGTFGADGQVLPNSQFLAEAVCADIPGYGSQIPATGMCDTQGVITAAGTFLGGTAQSAALRRVPGMRIGDVTFSPGSPATLSATIDVPASYTSADHFVSILLLDDQGRPVPLDYYRATTMQTDGSGQITGVTLTVDTALPERFRAVVMTDAFPAHTQQFGGPS